MDKDISYVKSLADAKIQELKNRTETMITEMEAGYKELSDIMSVSEGDFVKEMKEEIRSEYRSVQDVCAFYKELLKMMESAAEDFGGLDKKYSNEKVKQ